MGRMRNQRTCFLCCLLLISLLGQLPSSSAAAALEEKCSPEVNKLVDCLEFSTGKSDSPSEKCCGSVSDIRGKDPICLCFIIQQTFNSSSGGLKSLGVEFSKLIQLPTACKLANTSISNCPKLLGLSPSSPDNAIFNGSATSNSRSFSLPKSDGYVNRVHCGGNLVATVATVIFLSVFSFGI